MKKILITGANSYIGTSFENWIKDCENYKIDTVSTLNEKWKEIDFENYDVILHVAGIAHVRETKENANLYYEINRDLTIEIAKKAKKSGVNQFVLLSSMSVYGVENGTIYENTLEKPKTNYGISKLQADEEVKKFSDDNFKVAIIRPPMVYGHGCRGNYQSLSKFGKSIPLFIKTNNKRSMIYINILCEFIKNVIDQEKEGVYLPQNKNYISVDEMIRDIADANGKKIVLIGGFSKILRKIEQPTIKKVVGDLIYDWIDYGFDYQCGYDLKKTIMESEGKNL